jgi:hypothetical protein
MSEITFSANNLQRLLRVNAYEYSKTDLTVFGIRGAKPTGSAFDSFSASHKIAISDVNYIQPNCLLGIWNPLDAKIALFPGSTVPHVNYIKKHMQGIKKANCMMTGFYNHYAKGFHNPNERHAHQALKLATNIPMRRSTNDLVYTNADPIEVGNPHDNIHAAYCDTVTGNYSSAGCQVIVGQPKCKERNNAENTGYWKKFYSIIYGDTAQTKFDYSLFRFVDAEAVAISADNPMQMRLRFGSCGNSVLELQQKLKAAGYFHTNLDGSFGRNTLEAVINYQKQKFGINNADGVVGNATATSLGLVLPTI